MKIFWTLALFSLGFSLFAQVPEAPENYITDVAGLLSAEEKQQLNQRLAAFEDSTTVQIFVLLTRSLEGRVIEELTFETATRWAVGQKGADNGLLIAIYADDRQMRFEVGYGLEANLTDYETQTIQQDAMIPFIKEGDYFHAIEAGINQSIVEIAAPPQEPSDYEKQRQAFFENEINYPLWPPIRKDNNLWLLHWGVIVLIILLGLYPAYLLSGIVVRIMGVELKTPWKRRVVFLASNAVVFLIPLWFFDDSGIVTIFPFPGPAKIQWVFYVLYFFWMPILGVWLKMAKEIYKSDKKKKKDFLDFTFFEKIMYYIGYILIGGMIWVNLILISAWTDSAWGASGFISLLIVNSFMFPFVFAISNAFLGEGGGGGGSGSSGSSWSSSSSSCSSFSGGGGGSFGGGGSSSSW
ncbi:MAG: TPM domain-containing protein [Bacteroidia bacterium]|nr:TPM domain-containing protein [Bacteroidia bacterium]